MRRFLITLALGVAGVATAEPSDERDARETEERREQRDAETTRGWLHYAVPAGLLGVAGCVVWFVVQRDRNDRRRT